MILSKRAQVVLTAPQNGKIIFDSSVDLYKWNLVRDKKLTLNFESSYDQIRIPLMEAIALLLNQHEMRNLFILEFREVESFLRDQNDQQAFPELDMIELEVIYKQLLSDLMSILLKFIQKSALQTDTFIGKNYFWMKNFELFAGVEFVINEKDKLYFYNKRSDCIVSFNISE